MLFISSCQAPVDRISTLFVEDIGQIRPEIELNDASVKSQGNLWFKKVGRFGEELGRFLSEVFI